jgi:hypothetical protein
MFARSACSKNHRFSSLLLSQHKNHIKSSLTSQLDVLLFCDFCPALSLFQITKTDIYQFGYLGCLNIIFKILISVFGFQGTHGLAFGKPLGVCMVIALQCP